MYAHVTFPVAILALRPVSVQAAEEAEELRAREHERRVEQVTLSVRAAQYEVDRALEQYDLIDPKNRLVADTLEERLDQRLRELRTAARSAASTTARGRTGPRRSAGSCT